MKLFIDTADLNEIKNNSQSIYTKIPVKNLHINKSNRIAFVGLPDQISSIKRLVKNRLIKTVGQASARFQEDYSRMLRALRFSLQLESNIEQETFDTIRRAFNLGKTYLTQHGITACVEDFDLDDSVIQEGDEIIKKAEKKTQDIIESYNNDSLEIVSVVGGG